MKLTRRFLALTIAGALAQSACDDDDEKDGNSEVTSDDDGDDDTDGDDDADQDDTDGDDDALPDAGSSPPVDVEVPIDVGGLSCPSDEDELAEAFAEAVCSKRGECCSDDYEVCIVEVSAAFDSIYVDLAEAVLEETASVDCESFDTCVSAIAAASCGEWPAQVGDLAEIPVDVPDCRKLVTPALSAGDTCRWNYECSGGFCRSEDGLCYDFARENAPCEDALCDLPTMFCNGAGLCQKRLGNGVACVDSTECQSGRCALDASSTCVAPGAAQCEYVPAAPATCSARSGTGGNRGRTGWHLLGLALALCASRSAFSRCRTHS
jgi:hypothetical protein